MIPLGGILRSVPRRSRRRWRPTLLLNVELRFGMPVAAATVRPALLVDTTPTRITHEHAGHDKHAGHDPEMFRRRFWLSLALTIPLVATSHMVMDWFGYTLDLPLMAWYGPVLGSIVFWWGGWPFLAGGVAEVRDRQPGMMLLITMAITVAYVGVDGDQPRVARPRVLVGAGRARDDHAARSLAGDEGDRPGTERARRPRRAAARRGRPRRRRHDPSGAGVRTAGR